ncbi:hypothetical protein G3823_005335, partial [Escherichia coli]|nr:hypothetical protein [Escherichia coli]
MTTAKYHLNRSQFGIRIAHNFGAFLFQGFERDTGNLPPGRRGAGDIHGIRRQLVLPTRANYTGRTLQCDIKSR